MSRDGIDRSEWTTLCELARLGEAAGRLQVVGVMSHLACADEPGHPETATAGAAVPQRAAGRAAPRADPALAHLAATVGGADRPDHPFRHGAHRRRACTASTRRTPDEPARRDDPDRTRHGGARGQRRHRRRLRPALPTDRRTRLALLPLGYADGIPRTLTPDAAVLLRGRRVPIAGTVSMDQVVLDVGDAGIQVGEVATVFGPGDAGEPTIREWAGWAGTIEHDIVTRIGPRVARETVGRLPSAARRRRAAVGERRVSSSPRRLSRRRHRRRHRQRARGLAGQRGRDRRRARPRAVRRDRAHHRARRRLVPDRRRAARRRPRRRGAGARPRRRRDPRAARTARRGRHGRRAARPGRRPLRRIRCLRRSGRHGQGGDQAASPPRPGCRRPPGSGARRRRPAPAPPSNSPSWSSPPAPGRATGSRSCATPWSSAPAVRDALALDDSALDRGVRRRARDRRRRDRARRRHAAVRSRARDRGARRAASSTRPASTTASPTSASRPRSTTRRANELEAPRMTMFRALGCRGLARVDFFLTADGCRCSTR